MILKKLVIHNLASIPDATIDFEAAPLSNSDVYLISGEVGSGKSTILDAICLALYGDTPRFKRAKNTSKEDVEEDVKAYSPKQILRRGTGSCYARLSFEGNNGTSYEAEWSVARAHENPNGKLQNVKRYLRNLGNGNIVERVGEVEKEIAIAVGLDFDQFCRTTMLAQGEFTRFLAGNDNDKADILEKITNSGIFAEIGKKIFENFRKKEDSYKQIRRDIDAIPVMSDDELNTAKTQLAELSEKVKTFAAEKKKVEEKRNWLVDDKGIADIVAEATLKLAEAQANVESDSIKEAATIVERWDKTNDAREQLKSAKEAEVVRKNAEKTVEDCRNNFTKILVGKNSLDRRIADTERQIADLHKQIEEKSDYKEVYDTSGAIIQQIRQIVSLQKSIADIKSKQSDADTNVKNLTAKFEEMNAAVKNADEARTKIEEELTRLNEAVKKADLPSLRNQKDAIAKAENALKALEEAKSRLDEDNNNLKGAKTAIEELEAKMPEMDKVVADAQSSRDKAKSVYEGLKDSVDKIIKALRSRLKVGDECPLCRQKIVAALPNEEEIESIVSEARLAFENADTALEKANNEKNKLSAEIKAKNDVLAGQRETVNNSALALDAKKADAIKLTRACGIEIFDDFNLALTADFLSNVAARREDIEKKITEADAIEKQAKEQQNKYKSATDNFDEATRHLRAVENKLNEAKADKEKLAAKLEENNKNLEDGCSSVGESLGTLIWQHDWKSDSNGFVTELQSATENYRKQTEKLTDKQRDIESLKNEKADSETEIAKILEAKSEWAAISMSIEIEDRQLVQNAVRLHSALSTALKEIETQTKTEAEARSALNAFVESNEGYTIEILEELSAITPYEINRRRNVIGVAKELLSKADAVLKQWLGQQKIHNENRPELALTDTVEALGDAMDNVSKEIEKANQEIGAVDEKLKADSKVREQIEDKKKQAEELRLEFEKWNRLKELFGDSNGDKFKKIAQSYILANLIEAANHHMRTLTDRYKLAIVPGSFIIYVEDAYQGWARRSASTISGGETFLVSLALALALSDIGSRLNVNTLFIDEGFGTLSGEPLMKAINTLRNLHTATGRKVGIISHVKELQENIPVQIQVNKKGYGESEINIVG